MKVLKVIGFVIGFGVLALVFIVGADRQQAMKQAAQTDATRQDFINDCMTDAPHGYCACIYDGMGEQAIKDAYAYYEQSGEYNKLFKDWATQCQGEL